jgi:hypothetical protein
MAPFRTGIGTALASDVATLSLARSHFTLSAQLTHARALIARPAAHAHTHRCASTARTLTGLVAAARSRSQPHGTRKKEAAKPPWIAALLYLSFCCSVA